MEDRSVATQMPGVSLDLTFAIQATNPHDTVAALPAQFNFSAFHTSLSFLHIEVVSRSQLAVVADKGRPLSLLTAL